MIGRILDRLGWIFEDIVLQTFHVVVYHLMYIQPNGTSIPIDEIYLNAIVASAVSLPVVERMPLWLLCISFVLHINERFESELKKKAKFTTLLNTITTTTKKRCHVKFWSAHFVQHVKIDVKHFVFLGKPINIWTCIPNELIIIIYKRLAYVLKTYFRTWKMYKATNRREQAASALVRPHNHDSLWT